MCRSKNIRRKVSLDHMQKFTAECFDKPEESRKATRILKAILEAQSPRTNPTILTQEGERVNFCICPGEKVKF